MLHRFAVTLANPIGGLGLLLALGLPDSNSVRHFDLVADYCQLARQFAARRVGDCLSGRHFH